MQRAHKAFIALINRHDFFEAHEVLERIWFPIRHSDHPEKNILRGLINASVSFELIRRGRPEAAGKVWKTYLKYRPLIALCTSPNREYYEKIADAIEEVYTEFEEFYGYTTPHE